MRTVMRKAPPPLDRFIEALWYWEGDPLAHLKDNILASAGAGLLVNLADNHLRWYDGASFGVSHSLGGIGLAGPNSRAIAVDAFQRRMMGVKFQPGGAFPFFGVPISLLADRCTSLVELWGARASRLYERLVQAPTPDEKFDILLQALNTELRDARAYHPAVSATLQAITRQRRTNIASVAAQTGLSQKKFIKTFSEHVGFRPKLYQRVARFQRTLERIARAPDVDWGDIVEMAGYYDQSHFINDFEAFSGLSPGAYLKRRGPHLQHVPVPG